MAGTTSGTTGSVQRYQLKSNDTIRVTQQGQTPMLEIGNYHFQLPSNPTELQQVVNQFQNINWQQLNTGGSKSF